VSILFRTRPWLTLAQLARAWGDELAKDERGRQDHIQDLLHMLKEDIVNGRLDDSGPLRDGRRFGVALHMSAFGGKADIRLLPITVFIGSLSG
jgi:hypothetical protein